MQESFATMQAFPCGQVYLAEVNRIIVGAFTLYLLPNLTHQGRMAAVLENIVVAKAFRRRGIGKAMLNYARKEAEARNCYKLSLTSNAARTEAHAFYRRCGMVQHGYSFRYEL